jgi:nicotinamidase-related amidase/alkylated DNA repair dioxygenase AlkB
MPNPSDLAPERTALLVVDPQNDFLAEGGAFSKRHVPTPHLARSIAWLVAAARQQRRLVVWISSAYGEPSDARPGETHTGAPCCVRGTWGAEVIAELRPLFDGRGPNELHLEKRFYSPFRDTTLRDRLASLGIERVLLAGVATNVCVLAAAREARALGFEVDVIADATTAGTPGKHLAALQEIESLGGRRVTVADVLSTGNWPVVIDGLGAGDTALWCNVLGGDDYEAVEREVAWSAMFHRGGEVPRRVAIQGARAPDGVEPLYRHPVDAQPALAPFTPHVDAIRRAVEARVGHPLNHCLIQLYRDGRDWIGEHSDKTLDVARPSVIVNVSLGRTRTMVLRPKRAADEAPAVTQKIPLPHGSFLVMGLETNRAYYHAIKKEGAAPDGDGPRISLTFRHIGTWLDPSTGAVWGVGAKTRDRAEAELRARARAALPDDERARRDREEAEQMIRLFREENVDPSFDPAAYASGFDVIDFRTLSEAS